MVFENSFFETEVRSGFVVPSFIKYAWAAQLELLSVIDKICNAHSLNYYAAWGTLIGAVRHNGFIPWDDDLDIYMKRRDYEAFLKYAEDELPANAKLLNIYNDKEHGNCIATVFNTTTNCYDEEFLGNYANFPCAVGIDIVVLDYLPGSSSERYQLKEALDLLTAILEHYDTLTASEQKYQLGLVKQSLGKTISAGNSQSVKWQLRLLIEQICNSYSYQESDELANFVQWQREQRLKMRSECFGTTIMHQFENREIPIPSGYDEILRNEYGDYTVPINSGSGHAYPYFLPDYYRACIKMQIESYEPETMLMPRDKDYRQYQLQAKINSYVARAKQLEAELKMSFSQSGLDELRNISNAMQREITQENNRAKKVLFVVTQEKYWSEIEAVYKQVTEESVYDVDVLVVPHYYKRLGSKSVVREDESVNYPSNLHVISKDELENTDWHYDRIYMQLSWDEYDLTLSVDEDYYTRNLYNHTDYLVYIPYLNPDPYDEKSERADFTMQFICRQPAVIQADSIILPSEEMRNIYIRKLTEFTGEATRSIWEKKIEVLTQA